MSKLQTLRAVVTERLTAAAEDIFALFERTIAEYEEELHRFIDENRKQQFQDKGRSIVSLPVQSPGPGQDITDGAQITGKTGLQEEEPLTTFVQETGITVIVKTEDPLLLQGKTEYKEEPQEEEVSFEPHLHLDTKEQTEDSSGSDNDNWKCPLSCSDPLLGTEPDGGYNIQVQNRQTNKSGPETSASVKDRDKTETKADEKKHQCSFCMKRFVTKQGLQSHIRIHTGERPFKCSICEKVFQRKSVLEIHSLIHTKEKPFSCPICEKTFNQKSHLWRHKRKHTGERLYKCLVCEKTFYDKCVLEKHSVIHTDERPFSCSICEKTFNRKSSLTSHMRIHTGEKLYSCSVCGEAFAYRQILNAHIIKVHTCEKQHS